MMVMPMPSSVGSVKLNGLPQAAISPVLGSRSSSSLSSLPCAWMGLLSATVAMSRSDHFLGGHALEADRGLAVRRVELARAGGPCIAQHVDLAVGQLGGDGGVAHRHEGRERQVAEIG